jgi:hypothetical protein
MAKKKKRKTAKLGGQIENPKRILMYEDKTKFFTRDVRYLLFFMVWFIGFVIILLYNWKP